MTTLIASNITAETLKPLKLSSIAFLIKNSWPKVNYAAKPYLEAMEELDDISNTYGAESGKSIVLYFLSNASTYKGDVARLIKAELKRRAGL